MGTRKNERVESGKRHGREERNVLQPNTDDAQRKGHTQSEQRWASTLFETEHLGEELVISMRGLAKDLSSVSPHRRHARKLAAAQHGSSLLQLAVGGGNDSLTLFVSLTTVFFTLRYARNK